MIPDDTNHGLLPVGTATSLGRIEAVSLTAYRIGGRWVAFEVIHGPRRAATPLVWG